MNISYTSRKVFDHTRLGAMIINPYPLFSTDERYDFHETHYCNPDVVPIHMTIFSSTK